jgi:hypothetical protein
MPSAFLVFKGLIRLVFLRIFSDFNFGFQLQALSFEPSAFLDRISCALQQYKDAKTFTLPISYSTGQVKASIFGDKKTINGFLPF